MIQCTKSSQHGTVERGIKCPIWRHSLKAYRTRITMRITNSAHWIYEKKEAETSSRGTTGRQYRGENDRKIHLEKDEKSTHIIDIRPNNLITSSPDDVACKNRIGWVAMSRERPTILDQNPVKTQLYFALPIYDLRIPASWFSRICMWILSESDSFSRPSRSSRYRREVRVYKFYCVWLGETRRWHVDKHDWATRLSNIRIPPTSLDRHPSSGLLRVLRVALNSDLCIGLSCFRFWITTRSSA